MLTHYYTLCYIASSLIPLLRDRAVSSAWSQNRDELILAFSGFSGHLVVSCSADNPVLYLHDSIARARRNSLDIFPGIWGETIEAIEVRGGDRTVEIGLGSGRGLRALLFGAQSNVYLTDRDGTIIESFRSTGHLPGGTIPAPKSSDVFDFASFQERILSGGQSAVSAVLRQSFPILGMTLVQECCVRAGVPPVTPCREIPGETRTAIERSLLSIVADVEHPSARIYSRPDGSPSIFSIIPLQSAVGLTERSFDDIHQAVRFFLGRRQAAAGLRDELAQLTRPITQRLEKYQRTVAALESEISSASRASEYERNGSLLMANVQMLKKGDRQIILSDSGVAVTIALDPALSPVRNAQRYFDKAKKARTALDEGSSRLAALRSAIARGEEMLHGLESLTGHEELTDFVTKNGKVLEEFGAGKKSREREEIPFRAFTVDGGFEVWVGKSSANNDLLTLKYAKPDDLWFHARGSSGSHVILRVGTGKGEPSKKAREQSAAIAAFYSKMKTASMVPVAMTEKRYVRKPKGAAPGSVVIEREKVLFVEPALPESQHTT